MNLSGRTIFSVETFQNEPRLRTEEADILTLLCEQDSCEQGEGGKKEILKNRK